MIMVTKLNDRRTKSESMLAGYAYLILRSWEHISANQWSSVTTYQARHQATTVYIDTSHAV